MLCERAAQEDFSGRGAVADIGSDIRAEASELLLTNGTARADDTRTNNPGYRFIHDGWIDMLIDIDTMESDSDAGMRILEQCGENGANPLEDETMCAIFTAKYDDKAENQAALAELGDA